MNNISTRVLNSRDKNKNKGFSLVELIIVIAIMAVLTAILAPQLLRYVERSREAKDRQHVAELLRVLDIACVDYGTQAEFDAGKEVIYARAGGAATYKPNGQFGGLNPSLMAMMERFYGKNTITSINQYQLPEFTSRTFRAWNSGNGVTITFVILNADGTTATVGGGTTEGAMLKVQYKGPPLG